MNLFFLWSLSLSLWFLWYLSYLYVPSKSIYFPTMVTKTILL
jgi:hypothetical protein